MESDYQILITVTVACAFIVDMCSGDGNSDQSSAVVTAVNRRTNIDLYYLTNVSGHCTCDDQESLMVEERICMKNEELLKGNINT